MIEDEIIGWHHRLDGHEVEQIPGVGEGQESLASCSPWGRRELDTIERLTELNWPQVEVTCRYEMTHREGESDINLGGKTK